MAVFTVLSFKIEEPLNGWAFSAGA
jgi:hypothetical protein